MSVEQTTSYLTFKRIKVSIYIFVVILSSLYLILSKEEKASPDNSNTTSTITRDTIQDTTNNQNENRPNTGEIKF